MRSRLLLAGAGAILVALVVAGTQGRPVRALPLPSPPAVAADRDAALAEALAILEAARRSGDASAIARAEVLLAPFAADPEVLVVRATLRQHVHAWDAALADLDRALALRPDDAQGWITRAVILQALGRHPEALASCEAAAAGTTELVVAACHAGSRPHRESYAELLSALGRTRRAHPAERAWARGLLAEHAAFLLEAAAADAHYRAALALTPHDRYLARAYAAFQADRSLARALPGESGRW